MKDFFQIRKNLKNDFSNLTSIKIAVLGDSSTQFLAQCIRGLGYDYGLDLQILDADFNQIEQQVFDVNSEIYQYNPDLILVFLSSHKLLVNYNKSKEQDQIGLASTALNRIDAIYTAIQNQSNAKVIFYNYTEIDDSVFGSFSTKIESSFLFQLRKLNFELMLLAQKNPNLYLCDLSSIQNQIGKSNLFHAPVYISSEMVVNINVLPIIAEKTIAIINALNGKFKKCVILDLDNTLWGGIIGDDGIENIQIGNLGIGKAFSEFQYWIKKLKNRGVILAVCSKNTESIAKEPFIKHPDMVLKLDDISVFVANWDNKVDNIRYIQNVLNIGFDSMVFLDDNPFERAIVKENLPDIVVPDLPKDPTEYLEYLYNLNLFETVTFSDVDKDRTKLYQIEAERKLEKQSFTNEEDFLKNLSMFSVIESFNSFNIPRVAQLSQRSNQFNLRTIRYSENDIEVIASSEKHFTFTFTLEDKFGDNGLIAVVILEIKDATKLFIDSWFMSCRVLKRSMEDFILNNLVNFAKLKGFDTLIGEYIATPKNQLVQDHYEKLGFAKKADFWELDVESYAFKTTYVETKD
jgi:FkbH-like protein